MTSRLGLSAAYFLMEIVTKVSSPVKKSRVFTWNKTLEHISPSEGIDTTNEASIEPHDHPS